LKFGKNITVKTKFVSISFLDIFYLISQFVFKMLITGRYNGNGTSREDRFCQFCPSLVEDEMHFLLRCAKYQNIRTSYNSLFQKEEGTNDNDILQHVLASFIKLHICLVAERLSGLRITQDIIIICSFFIAKLFTFPYCEGKQIFTYKNQNQCTFSYY
jgi:hypothetical protein